jgi:hypothetical protein
MWTDHAEIEAVLENLVRAEEAAAEGVRVRPSCSEKLSFVFGYDQELREKAWSAPFPRPGDLQAAFGT